MGWITLDIDIDGFWRSKMDGNFPTYEQKTADVLSRYSVSDLYEQTEADLERADRLFYDSALAVEVIESGHVGLISFWKIKSGERQYEVRRFKQFVWCSCKDFFFRKKCCKHCAITSGVYCINCRELRADKDKLCVPCQQNKYRFGGRPNSNTAEEKINESVITKN